jgi:hypothetical protein
MQSFKVIICFFIVAIIAGFSCTKMDNSYKGFLKDGEIIYTGKADSLTAFSGKNRVKLRWLLVSDPKISKCIAFWNNKRDSLVVPVQKSAGADVISVLIDNLPEDVYSFEVYTYDDKGHSSVKSEVTGVSYGDIYESSIFNRSINTISYSSDKKNVIIKWYGIAQQAVVVEVRYTDASGSQIVKNFKALFNAAGAPLGFSNQDILSNYKYGSTFSYRTGFLPTATAIDTFYTDYKDVVPL